MGNIQTRKYLAIWTWLMALVLISITAASVLPKPAALTLIFTAAALKAVLVARHYMHLKQETAIVCAIVIVPLAFIVIFLFGLFPDFVFHLTKP